jgi:ribosome-binding factor A
MGRQLRLKRTPLLTFEVDPAVVAGGKVEEALRRIREAERDRGAADGPEPGDG